MATSSPTALPSQTRTLWLPLILLTLTLLSVYGVVLHRLALAWFTNDDMSHGPFVPVLSLYILAHRWKRITHIRPEPNLFGLALLLFGALLLCVGPPGLATFAVITRYAFLVSLTGLILYIGGWPILRELIYPVGLLVLMVPLPSSLLGSLTLRLQMLASQLAEFTLELFGYSIFRQGNIIHLPGQILSVAEACSGLRSLLSLSFLAQVYIYVLNGSALMRFLLALLVIPIAILANTGRIVTTAFLSGIDKNLAHGSAHDYTGWAVFVVSFAATLLAHQLLRLVLPSRLHKGKW